jgi:hypothetical protein
VEAWDAPSRSSPPRTRARQMHGFQRGQPGTSTNVSQSRRTGRSSSTEPSTGSGGACGIAPEIIQRTCSRWHIRAIGRTVVVDAERSSDAHL